MENGSYIIKGKSTHGRMGLKSLTRTLDTVDITEKTIEDFKYEMQNRSLGEYKYLIIKENSDIHEEIQKPKYGRHEFPIKDVGVKDIAEDWVIKAEKEYKASVCKRLKLLGLDSDIKYYIVNSKHNDSSK